MFRTLQRTIPEDSDYPERRRKLQVLAAVRDGRLYDGLRYDWHEEKNDAGEYIRLADRRPCARYNLCRLVVDDAVSLLFSEGHFPEIDTGDDKATREALQALVKDARINELMLDAATRGSVGSVAILMRVLRDRAYFSVLETEFLTPEWDAEAPDTLKSVRRQYKTTGRALVESGYTGISKDDAKTEYWIRTVWDADAERWFSPVKVSDWKDTDSPEALFVEDPSRTVTHSLGFVPMVWVKNLPGGDEIDGAPSFSEAAIDTNIEIEYLLSQSGRGLKYAADPTLLIKEPAFGSSYSQPVAAGEVTGQGGEAVVRGAANALVVDAQGDAKLLEINGTAAEAVEKQVRLLREFCLEMLHGNRANADKLSAAQSGRAMELMLQALIWLADRMRASYGEGALLDVLRMAVMAGQKRKLKRKDGDPLGEMSPKASISLRWPAWCQPTAQDDTNTATTLTTLVGGGVMSAETAVKSIAARYDIEDVPGEVARIASESAERAAAAAKQNPPE